MTMKGSRLRNRILLVVAWLLLVCTTTVLARTPDASNVAIGDWDLRIRCNQHFFSSFLFPATQTIEGSHPSKLLPRPPLFGLAQEYPCQLSIFPNGTFALRPTKFHMPPSQQADNRLFVRGRWNLQANPYCITDRFYDQLHLKSYPRRLVPRTRTQEATPGKRPLAFLKHRMQRRKDPNKNLLWRQQLSLSLHCRVCGRYASPGPWKSKALIPSKRRRCKETKARITHGLLVWQKENRKQQQTTARDGRQLVGASFRGKRIVRRNVLTKYEEEQELEMFGY